VSKRKSRSNNAGNVLNQGTADAVDSAVHDGSELAPEIADLLAGMKNASSSRGDQHSNEMSPIVRSEDGAIELSNIRIHRIGLDFVGEVTEEEYETFGEMILQFDTAYQWIVGDYLAYGVDNNYGLAKKFAERLDRDPTTVHDWTYVCGQVTFSERSENLSFGHHKVVAKMNAEDRAYWLKRAEEGNGKQGDAHKVWSKRRLEKEIAEASGEALPSKRTSPAYKRWAEQSQDRAAKALSQFKKTNDGRTRNAWKRFAEAEAQRWQTVLEEMDNE